MARERGKRRKSREKKKGVEKAKKKRIPHAPAPRQDPPLRGKERRIERTNWRLVGRYTERKREQTEGDSKRFFCRCLHATKAIQTPPSTHTYIRRYASKHTQVHTHMHTYTLVVTCLHGGTSTSTYVHEDIHVSVYA